MGRMLWAVALVAVLTAGTVRPAVAGTQIDLLGPPGSGAFGTSVTVLPNGNLVVTDPGYDAGPIADAGAVYLYDGETGSLISTLTGTTTGDAVGSGGVTALPNGNFVVVSSGWDNGADINAGAVTWSSGTTGIDGVVSPENSLVGEAYHSIGSRGITVLSNGNYVVSSENWQNGTAINAGAVTWGNGETGVHGVVSAENSLVGRAVCDGVYNVTALPNGDYLVYSVFWDNGGAFDAGAVTWGSGVAGVSGEVSAENSLVGSAANDRVGSGGIILLSNGNYLVVSPEGDSGTTGGAGAVTWGGGATGIRGAVSAENSLVGSSDGDAIGNQGVTELGNGNYVMLSPLWDGTTADVGAATWGSGSVGITGTVSEANSLVGSSTGDMLEWEEFYGPASVVPLSNGNYLVRASAWDNGGAVDAGAVTWGDGAAGTSGVISTSNSLVGSTAGDEVGSDGVTLLTNGNYVVTSPRWDHGAAADAGAVTWGDGSTGIAGVVSDANSLVTCSGGIPIYPRYGPTVTALSNGNYVVLSPYWDNGAVDNAGAVTWGDGMAGIAGLVSEENSLVGSNGGDMLNYPAGVAALGNGNYVVSAPGWDNGAIVDAGAVTWGNGATGSTGVISAANSLVGSTPNDVLGSYCVTPLTNGSYVVCSSDWDNGPIVDAGAVTWGSGETGIQGALSAANSLVGSTAGDRVGSRYVFALPNGHYLVSSWFWDNGAVADAGAVTWGNGTTGIQGTVSAANSLVGASAGEMLGDGIVTMLSNGNYVIHSATWDNGDEADVGAVTWGNSMTGVRGMVSAANSLVGSTAGDMLSGCMSVTALRNGSYVVTAEGWANGAVVDAGAVTWVSWTGSPTGPIMAENSVLGTSENSGASMHWTYDAVNHQLVVGRPADNAVTLFKLPPAHNAYLPVTTRNAR